MPVVLALLVAFLTGAFSTAGSLSIRTVDARPLVSDPNPVIGRELLVSPFRDSAFPASACERIFSVAIVRATRDNSEAMREAEEEESEDEHFSRSLASALILPTLWNGPSEHARPAPDPSRLPRSRRLFLLCGQLLC